MISKAEYNDINKSLHEEDQDQIHDTKQDIMEVSNVDKFAIIKRKTLLEILEERKAKLKQIKKCNNDIINEESEDKNSEIQIKFKQSKNTQK